jgi:PAS domain-containing protein
MPISTISGLSAQADFIAFRPVADCQSSILGHAGIPYVACSESAALLPPVRVAYLAPSQNLEGSMVDDRGQVGRSRDLDYKLIFNLMPGMCLVLDTAFNILAQNADHAAATLSIAKDVVGRNLFDAFPDNPYDFNASGVALVRQSLLTVLKTRQADAMPIVRYDVQPELGGFEVRYWAITNTPVLGEDGFVRWIINRAEDATELAVLRQQQRRTTGI